MVSGKPPNHSKTPDEPVTIDLEADKTVDFEEADGVVDRDLERSSDGIVTPRDADDQTASDPGHKFPGPAESEPAPTAAADPPHQDYARDDPKPVDRHAATSGLIAAGIFGGLVALIGVGAIQYAGLLPSGSSSKSNAAEISALNAEIDGLKQTVATLAAAPPAKSDDAIESRLSALEASVKDNQAAGATNAANAGPAASDPAAAQKFADLTAEVAQLKATITQTTQAQASTGADMSKRLDDAEKKLSEPGKDAAVARAIAAAALKAAIDRGGPFRPELDTFAGVAPDDPAVADLKTFADTGVPSRADLLRQVPDVATAIVGVTQQPDQNQSWSDRLMASAKSLVKVRPVGNIEGDSVDAIAARFEDKVKNGDLPGAVTEWNALPPPGKAASAAFKQSVEARIRVEDLVGEALSNAIAGAGKQS